MGCVCTILLYYIALCHRDREGIFESYGSEEHLDADQEVLVACCHCSRLKWWSLIIIESGLT